MDDCRTADEQYALATGQYAEQFARDFAQQGLARLFTRDGAGHELEHRFLTRALRHLHAYALVSDNHPFAGANVGRCNGARRAVLDNDRAIHLRQRRRQPTTADPYFGREIRRGVKQIGQNAFGRRRFGRGVVVGQHRDADVA